MAWCRLNPDRAVFVLGNFADGIELWVRENVCGSLYIGEGNENHPLLYLAIRPSGEFDRSSPRRYPNQLTCGDTVASQRGGMQTCRGTGFERVENQRAARHRTRVPMFELAAGNQDKRILVIGDLGGRENIGRYDACPATLRGGVSENDRLARVVGRRAWIHDRGFRVRGAPT